MGMLCPLSIFGQTGGFFSMEDEDMIGLYESKYLLTEKSFVFYLKEVVDSINEATVIDTFENVTVSSSTIFYANSHGLWTADKKDSLLTIHFYNTQNKKMNWQTTLNIDADIKTFVPTDPQNFVIGGSISINQMNTDHFLLKASKHGAVVWDLSFGGPRGKDVINDLTLSEDGNILAIGTVDDFGIQNYFAAIYKIGLDGKILWEKKMGRPEKNTFGRVISKGTKGNIIIGCLEDQQIRMTILTSNKEVLTNKYITTNNKEHLETGIISFLFKIDALSPQSSIDLGKY